MGSIGISPIPSGAPIHMRPPSTHSHNATWRTQNLLEKFLSGMTDKVYIIQHEALVAQYLVLRFPCTTSSSFLRYFAGRSVVPQ